MSDLNFAKLSDTDIELSEKYASGRMTTSERLEFDKRLRLEIELRDSVEAHSVLIAAINTHGRQQLKSRLRESLSGVVSPGRAQFISMTPGHQHFATSLLKAAALLILGILMSVALNQIWTVEDSVVISKYDSEDPQDQVKDVIPDPADKALAEKGQKNPVANAQKKKPQLASVPSRKLRQSNHRYLTKMAIMEPLNEIFVELDDRNAGTRVETKILFQNPFDLSAMNIKKIADEQNDLLQWFYAHYENNTLFVFLDNMRYRPRFEKSVLVRLESNLLISIADGTFVLDLTPNGKIKKVQKQ